MRNAPRGHFWFLSICVVVFPSNLSFSRDDALLDQVRLAHLAAVGSIRTLHCQAKISFRPPSPGGSETVGEYWRSGDAFRCRSRDGTVVTDSNFRDGVTRSYTWDSASTGDMGRDGRILTGDFAYSCNPWSYGLLNFFGKERFRVGLADLLDRDGQVGTVRRESRDGRELVRLDVSHSRADLQIWFDPAVIYLARHVRITDKPPNGVKDGNATVEEFQEPLPGVYFPAKVRCEITSGETNRKTEWVATFTDLRVNEPLPPGSLDVRFPPGLLVDDAVRDGLFRTDASGEPILPPKNAEGKLLKRSTTPPVPTAVSSEPQRVTAEEPQPRTDWLIPASLALFMMAAVLWSARTVRGALARRRDD